MSDFMLNRFEVLGEEPQPAGSAYDPKRVEGDLIYYNPGLGRRIRVRSFGPGLLPAFDNDKVWAALATDHLVQHLNLTESPLYIKIQGITQKLKERKNMAAANRVLNVKMALPKDDQQLVDSIEAAMNNRFVPSTWEENVLIHAVKRAMQKPRFEVRGGRKRATHRKMKVKRMRTKSRK
jgi:hypothetical protein